MIFNPILHILPSGLTVILDPMDLVTTTVKVFFNTGSRDEAENELGLTHFCEHMLCKGTPSFPNKVAIDNHMDYHGGWRNAATSISSLAFYGRIVAENAHLLISFLGDQLQNSLFDPKKIEIERKVVCDELRRAQDDPNRQFNSFMAEHVFNWGTSSLRTLGSVETIMSFTREQMLEFISRRLSAKNCIICVSGKIADMDKTLKHIEQVFSFLPTHDVTANTDILYTPCVIHNLKPEQKNVRLRIIFPDIWPFTMDYYFNNLSVGRFERYINKQIANVLRQDNGLVYGFGGFNTGNERHFWNGFATETSATNIERVVQLIAQNAYDIYNNLGITEDDLDRYNRKDALGEADFKESATQRCDKLVGFYRHHKQLYEYDWVTEQIHKITPQDVQKYSRGFFDGPMSIVTQGADFKADLATIWQENFKPCKK